MMVWHHCFMRRLLFFLIAGILVGHWSCQTAVEPASVINTQTVLPDQAALVSVQSTGSSTAEVIVKLTTTIRRTDWQLTVLNSAGNGTNPTLSEGSIEQLDLFNLTTFKLSNLSAGQTYRLQLGFLYNQKDTITVERIYTHTTYNPWKRLAHLVFNDGLYTGSVIDRSDDLSGQLVRLTRYVDDDQWQSNVYSYRTNQWFTTDAPSLPPRRGMVEYNVFFQGKDLAYFYGLGYLVNDEIPGKYAYQRDMYAILNGFFTDVIPFYGGQPGELAYFITTEWAYFLTNNGSPAMRRIYADLDQEERAPLPEAPGVLATFSIGEMGYVVNQAPGQQPHLFAYDSETDVWTRKADFPGKARSRGIGFSVKNKGYYGLGTDANQQGLRDLWQYDPATDQWQYHTDYPGQGNTYVVVFSPSNKQTRTYIGFGYENQTRTDSPAIRIVGCTDFWEFAP